MNYTDPQNVLSCLLFVVIFPLRILIYMSVVFWIHQFISIVLSLRIQVPKTFYTYKFSQRINLTWKNVKMTNFNSKRNKMFQCAPQVLKLGMVRVWIPLEGKDALVSANKLSVRDLDTQIDRVINKLLKDLWNIKLMQMDYYWNKWFDFFLYCMFGFLWG